MFTIVIRGTFEPSRVQGGKRSSGKGKPSAQPRQGREEYSALCSALNIEDRASAHRPEVRCGCRKVPIEFSSPPRPHENIAVTEGAKEGPRKASAGPTYKQAVDWVVSDQIPS